MKIDIRSSEVTYLLMWTATLVFSLIFVFHDVIFSLGENAVVAIGDGRLMLAQWEHWFLVFKGELAWNDPGYFFPEPNVLGFTDSFFLNGCIHSSFRLLGFEPVTSMTCTIILLAIAGFSGFGKVLTQLGISRWLALFVSTLFMIGGPIQTAIGNSHIQLLNIWIIPWVVLIFQWSLGAFSNGNRLRAQWLACMSVALFSLVAISTFYIAWFFVFVVSLGLFIFSIWNIRELRKNLLWVIERTRLWLFAGLTGIPFLLIFLLIYLPAHQISGGRVFEIAIVSLPDLANFGTHSSYNWFWHSVVQLDYQFPHGSYQHELYYGFPWIFLFICLIIWFWSLWQWIFNRDKPGESIALLGTIIFVGWILVLRIDDSSLWRWVMEWYPGADGIRAVFRINMLYYALALVFLANAITEAKSRYLKRSPVLLTIGAIAFASLLIAENWQMAGPFRLQLSDEQQLKAIIEPPLSPVKAFWAYREGDEHWEPIQKVAKSTDTHVKAIRASQILGIPTINGYSGVFPQEWRLLTDAANGLALAPVTRWMIYKQFNGPIGILDIETGRWHEELLNPAQRLSQEVGVLTGRNLASGHGLEPLYLEGWSIYEGSPRWSTAQNARVLIPNLDQQQELFLRLGGNAYVPGDHELDIEIWLGERRASVYKLSGEKRSLDEVVLIDAADIRPDGVLEILFVFSNPISPKSVGESWDSRDLGLSLTILQVDARP